MHFDTYKCSFNDFRGIYSCVPWAINSVGKGFIMLKNLEKILNEKAPLILEALQGGADHSEIEKLESLIGSDLPNDFKLLYRSRNGFEKGKFANLFYGFPFMRLDSIISAQEKVIAGNHSEPLRYADDGIKGSYTFGLRRIPIGDDSGSSLLCVDLDPSDSGRYGQVIFVDYDMEVALRLHSSVEELVQAFETDLGGDRYSLQEDALEDGVHWLQPISEIDPINWFRSPRWKYVKTALKNS